MSTLKILITGSNGLLGSSLVPMLLSGSNIVFASGRGPNRTIPDAVFQNGNLRYVSIDLLDGVQIEQCILDIRPDIIVHAGALTQVDYCEQHWVDCWNTNVTATRFIIEAARKTGSSILFVSTDFVFDGVKGMYREADRTGPVNYYGSSKLAAEKSVMDSGLDWSIARTVLVYGNPKASRRTNILTWVRDQLTEGKKIQVVNDQLRTPTFVDDLAEGIQSIINKKASGIYHLSGKEILSPYTMAMKTADYLGLDASLISPVNADTFSQPAKRPLKTGFDISKAVRDLNYNPVSFSEGMQKVFS